MKMKMMRMMTMILVSAGFGVLPACGGGGIEGRPDCGQIDCGPNGACVAGACQCDPGFQPTADGLGCEPFRLDHCEGVDCSGLGHCSMEPLGLHGVTVPACVCDPGTVRSEDLLDCVDPCSGVDCAPGLCAPDADGRGVCDCPPGFEALDDPPTCREQTSWAWQLVLDPDGDPYVLGHAHLDVRTTAEGHQVEASTSYWLPISYVNDLSSQIRTVARYDEDGALVEAVQDHQLKFGSVQVRRRLHAWLDAGPEGDLLRFESRILDRIWHGALPTEGAIPPLMAEGVEYPIFSYGCFDPFFFFDVFRAVDPAGPADQSLTVLSPAFVFTFDQPTEVTSADGLVHVTLPQYGVSAEYSAGMLDRVTYEWAAWLPAPASAPLEMNLWPLPTTPIEHQPQAPPAAAEQEVSFVSADGTALAGSLVLPTGQASDLAVLMVPSLLPGDRDQGVMYTRVQRDLAAYLAQAGVASLRFDGRGIGRSEGDPLSDPDLLAQDVQAAHAWLAADERFVRIVLLGYGFSTPRALRAAGSLDHAGLVLLAPTGPDLVADLFHLTRAVILEAELGQQMIDDWFAPLAELMEALETGSSTEPYRDRSATFWRYWLNRDLLDVSGLDGPVLLLAGTDDLNLPLEDLDLLADALTSAGNPPTIQVFDGLTHTLTPGSRASLWEEIHLPEPVAADVGDAIATWLAAL